MLVHCTVVRARSSVNLRSLTWNREPRTSWWPPTWPDVVSTSRTCLWSSITTWPRPSKTTRIVSVVRDVRASTALPYPSAPKTIRRSFTIWNSCCWLVPCRRARRNWPIISTLSISRAPSSSVKDAMRRSLLDWFSSFLIFNWFFEKKFFAVFLVDEIISIECTNSP